MNAPVALENPRRLAVTADMFQALFDAGLLGGGRTVELRLGEIVEMSPIYLPHARVDSKLQVAIARSIEQAGLALEVIGSVSVRASDISVPQPDIVILGATDAQGFAPRDAVAVAIEVSDSTLADDLGPKSTLYADAGIPEYWVVDVKGRTIRMHADGNGENYETVKVVPFGEPLVSLTIEGLSVDTSGL